MVNASFAGGTFLASCQKDTKDNMKYRTTCLCPSSESTFSQPFIKKCSDVHVVRIGRYNHLSLWWASCMKNQVLQTVWCNISGEDAGEIWNLCCALAVSGVWDEKKKQEEPVNSLLGYDKCIPSKLAWPLNKFATCVTYKPSLTFKWRGLEVLVEATKMEKVCTVYTLNVLGIIGVCDYVLDKRSEKKNISLSKVWKKYSVYFLKLGVYRWLVVSIGVVIILHLSKQWKAKFFILRDGNSEHSSWSGLPTTYQPRVCMV